MRATFNISDELLEQAQQLTGLNQPAAVISDQ